MIYDDIIDLMNSLLTPYRPRPTPELQDLQKKWQKCMVREFDRLPGRFTNGMCSSYSLPAIQAERNAAEVARIQRFLTKFRSYQRVFRDDIAATSSLFLILQERDWDCGACEWSTPSAAYQSVFEDWKEAYLAVSDYVSENRFDLERKNISVMLVDLKADISEEVNEVS